MIPPEQPIRSCDSTCPNYIHNSPYCSHGPKPIKRPEDKPCFYELPSLADIIAQESGAPREVPGWRGKEESPYIKH